MAKKSKIVNNKYKIKLANQYYDKRDEIIRKDQRSKLII